MNSNQALDPQHPLAIVVGASTEQAAYVEKCLADWRCVDVPFANGGIDLPATDGDVKLAIVFAQKQEHDTVATCEQIRASRACADAPILLVIGRYEIGQGTSVRRMGNATFVLTPFSPQQLCDKINDLVA